MEDPVPVPVQVIHIDKSPSSQTTSTAMDSAPKFSGMLKNQVSSPALLLTLSLATSTINILLVVEDIGLIKTDFLKENGMKLELQKSVLLTKSISNLNRSSEFTDTFEIIVNSTPTSDKIEALERMIDELTSSKPENWRAEYHFSLKGVDDVKHVYELEITDVREFQNYKVKKYQRTELIDKLRQLFKDLEIMNVTIQ